MTPDHFVHWLQGYLDASGSALSNTQVEYIKQELDKVTKKDVVTYTTTGTGFTHTPMYFTNTSEHSING